MTRYAAGLASKPVADAAVFASQDEAGAAASALKKEHGEMAIVWAVTYRLVAFTTLGDHRADTEALHDVTSAALTTSSEASFG